MGSKLTAPSVQEYLPSLLSIVAVVGEVSISIFNLR